MSDYLKSFMHSESWWRLSGRVVRPPFRVRQSPGRGRRGRGLRGLRVSGADASAPAATAPVPRYGSGGRGVVHARRSAGVGRDVGPRGD